MADPTLLFTPETTPSLSHWLVGFRTAAEDEERNFQLAVLHRFFKSLGGVARPTHLLGGVATALDGLSAGLLAALPDDFVLELFFAGSVSARYRLRAVDGAETESAPWRVVCDNNTARLWQLLDVHKEGVPCLWNPDTSKWHQQVAAGTDDAVTQGVATEEDAFSLPT
jgi:hypothetical protein